jgi:Zn-dependent peptidase ImmA (M78 family)
MVGDPSSFSAATVFCGHRRLIIFNPVHAPGRHANSIAHELAHVLLEHEPGAVRESGGGRRWRPMDEAEADWLAATLLVPRDGALEVMYELGAVEAAADHFGVSRQLMHWRLNQTGVALQLRRRADKQSAVG